MVCLVTEFIPEHMHFFRPGFLLTRSRPCLYAIEKRDSYPSALLPFLDGNEKRRMVCLVKEFIPEHMRLFLVELFYIIEEPVTFVCAAFMPVVNHNCDDPAGFKHGENLPECGNG